MIPNLLISQAFFAQVNSHKDFLVLIHINALMKTKINKMDEKQNKDKFKTKKAMILFNLTFGKNVSATFISA